MAPTKEATSPQNSKISAQFKFPNIFICTIHYKTNKIFNSASWNNTARKNITTMQCL